MTDFGNVLDNSNESLKNVYHSINNNNKFEKLYKHCQSLLDAYKSSSSLKQTSLSGHADFMNSLKVCREQINNDQLGDNYEGIATLNQQYLDVLGNIEKIREKEIAKRLRQRNIKGTFKQMKEDYAKIRHSNNIFTVIFLVVIIILVLLTLFLKK